MIRQVRYVGWHEKEVHSFAARTRWRSAVVLAMIEGVSGRVPYLLFFASVDRRHPVDPPTTNDFEREPSLLNPAGQSQHRPARIGVPIYEELLNGDPRWALSEGSRHFEENSAVFKALHGIAHRLRSLRIPYAVVGGMALFRHGLRRFTEDVDLLVTKDDLKTIHEKLDGLGYLPPFAKSKHLRDTELGVRIEFLTTGDYPGDGKKKPVSFPDPRAVSFEADGVSYIKLEALVELKLASGMTHPGRLKDLSDVLELIKVLNLPLDFADQLHPFVKPKYQELWKEARKRYVTTWRNKWLTAEAKSIEDMAAMLRAAAEHLEQMRKDGVFLDDQGGVGDDYAHLVTTDAKAAEKYGLIDESEYWDDQADEEVPDDEGPADEGPANEPTVTPPAQ